MKREKRRREKLVASYAVFHGYIIVVKILFMVLIIQALWWTKKKDLFFPSVIISNQPTIATHNKGNIKLKFISLISVEFQWNIISDGGGKKHNRFADTKRN